MSVPPSPPASSVAGCPPKLACHRRTGFGGSILRRRRPVGGPKGPFTIQALHPIPYTVYPVPFFYLHHFPAFQIDLCGFCSFDIAFSGTYGRLTAS